MDCPGVNAAGVRVAQGPRPSGQRIRGHPPRQAEAPKRTPPPDPRPYLAGRAPQENRRSSSQPARRSRPRPSRGGARGGARGEAGPVSQLPAPGVSRLVFGDCWARKASGGADGGGAPLWPCARPSRTPRAHPGPPLPPLLASSKDSEDGRQSSGGGYGFLAHGFWLSAARFTAQ